MDDTKGLKSQTPRFINTKLNSTFFSVQQNSLHNGHHKMLPFSYSLQFI